MAIERKPSIYIIIKGKVQGVSFRYFTLKQAQELNIVGWVRNKQNGTVEAVAQGDKINLGLFIKKLKQGSSFSSVDDIMLNWENEKKNYEKSFKKTKAGEIQRHLYEKFIIPSKLDEGEDKLESEGKKFIDIIKENLY